MQHAARAQRRKLSFQTDIPLYISLLTYVRHRFLLSMCVSALKVGNNPYPTLLILQQSLSGIFFTRLLLSFLRENSAFWLEFVYSPSSASFSSLKRALAHFHFAVSGLVCLLKLIKPPSGMSASIQFLLPDPLFRANK
jgi:hypothetical protein